MEYMKKPKYFEINDAGEIEQTYYRVNSISAANKSEALKKFAAYGQRMLRESINVKVKNGAWQLSYPAFDGGTNVESGVEGRDIGLCGSTVTGRKVTDDDASFSYYASDEYRNSK